MPTICIYEVFKKILSVSNESDAISAVAQMKKGQVLELTFDISLLAAKISYQKKLAMADSIIFASANAYDAIIWTQDKNFEGLENVNYYSV